jgi:hypothetical protein
MLHTGALTSLKEPSAPFVFCPSPNKNNRRYGKKKPGHNILINQQLLSVELS